MTVSLSQVLASARARSAPLAGECAGYLVLAAADHAAQGPRRIEAGSVELHPDGSVRVVGGLPSNEAITERDLRELLDELLLVAGSVTPGLLRAARRRTAAGIDGFVREIETALIPVNRAAARRALARLERETSRAVERGALVIENQRVSDRVLSPEPPAASPAPPASLTPPPATLMPPPPVASVTPPPASLTPPPVSLTPPPVSTSPASRPASDLAPTPVAVPVRAKLALPLPVVEETPSRFETRPETVVARASRAPAKPSVPPVVATHASVSPLVSAPCTPPPPESMTPFLGTATAQRSSSWVPVPSVAPKVLISDAPARDDDADLDVPIEVEMPAEVAVAAPLEDVAEDDIVEAPSDELTEPFYLDDDGSKDPGPLAFHELTALMGDVAPVAEPVIELAQSPTPAPEVAPEAEVSPEAEVAPDEVIVAPAAEVPEAVAVAPLEDVPAAVVNAEVEVEVTRGEFDDVELAVLLPSAEPPPVVLRKAVVDPESLLPRRPLPRQSASNVDELLLSFGHAPSEDSEEQDVRSTLKRLAGLEPTPPPPGASRD